MQFRQKASIKHSIACISVKNLLTPLYKMSKPNIMVIYVLY